ncbi:MAG: aminotransferase class V-fold PLP-dependent enzyme [Myxococcales bacterium]|nr:aminotransferase class V-fold PLP-dependent enzyme [Myxococcales bacterium]
MTVERGIILAAGRGSRLVNGSGIPKPLVEVGGRTLIQHVLAAFREAGLREAVVVVGYQGEKIRQALAAERGIEITIVENPDWQKSNGVSLLAAAKYIDRPCILSMADHLYEAPLVRTLCRLPVHDGVCHLMVDEDPEACFDIDDATKVGRLGDRIVAIGKDLADYDAIDCGVFRITPALVDALAAVYRERGDCSLSDGVRLLCGRGLMRAVPAAGELWLDVDTPQALRHAQALLRIRELERGAERPYLLMNPGPVSLSPGVRRALVSADLCHRDEDFTRVFESVRRKLRRVFGASIEHDVLVFCGSGTAAVEAGITNFVPRGGKLLVVRNGAFGERLAEVARAFHIPLAEVPFAWGETVDLARVEQALDADPAITTVAMVHHETSTGLLNPVRQLGALCRSRNLLFVVDAVASLGGEDLDVTRDNIDVCVSSANKCLHGISSVSFLCMSERAWDRIRDDEPRGYYLDVRKYRAYARLGQTPFTPAVQGLLALDRALAEALELGLGRKRLRYQALNEAIRAGLAEMGIGTFTATGSEAHVITIARVPEGIAFHDLYDEMKRRGYLIYECKAALANRYFQVANMGAMTMDDVQGFLAALRQVLLEHGCLVEKRAAALG